MRDVCSAVDAAHRNQLVHRDLKPENIFLVDADGHRRAKVLDFGIAKILAEDTTLDGRHITRTGEVVGTLAYMSPEQLRGEDLTFDCDVWALAMIAYEMLTGSHAFATRAAHHVAAARQGMPRENTSALTPGVQRFFDRALATRTADRPASAASFIAAFERALGDFS
jgi:serine/threonine-protein kinase